MITCDTNSVSCATRDGNRVRASHARQGRGLNCRRSHPCEVTALFPPARYAEPLKQLCGREPFHADVLETAVVRPDRNAHMEGKSKVKREADHEARSRRALRQRRLQFPFPMPSPVPCRFRSVDGCGIPRTQDLTSLRKRPRPPGSRGRIANGYFPRCRARSNPSTPSRSLP